VVGILAALGGRGVTVVLSIHQPRPDVLRLMDRALILSGFGEVVYSGEPQTSRCPVHSTTMSARI
jgi:ATP-binding cassette subfamily G (WHITE) protein 2